MRKFGFDTMFVLVQWFLKIWKGWINWQKFSPVCDWVFRFPYCDFAFRWKVGESGRAKKKQQPKNCLKAFQFVRHFGCCTCACDLRQRHRHVKVLTVWQSRHLVMITGSKTFVWSHPLSNSSKSMHSLRGRRLEGKGKGVLCARETLSMQRVPYVQIPNYPFAHRPDWRLAGTE